MPEIMTQEARDIAKKLSRDIPSGKNRQRFAIEQSEGKEHTIIKVFYGATFIGQYGIQRSSKPKRHNYVAEQLHLSRNQAFNLARCPFSVDDYIDELIARSEIEDPDLDQEQAPK